MRLAGIELPNNIKLDTLILHLNGAAIRSKFFIETYILSLYSIQKITDEETAIHSIIDRSLRMQIITPLATAKIVSENIESGMKEGLGGSYHTHKNLVEEIKNAIAIAGIQYKDTIDIFYSSKKELKLFKNEKEIYFNPDGTLLAETILNLYLGKKPKDAKIKQALLKGF